MALALGNNLNSFGTGFGGQQNSMSLAIAITSNVSEEQAAQALGQQAPQPEAGKAGKHGKHGKAGKNGKHGKNGKNGKNGKAGKNGKNGCECKDGYSSPLHQAGPNLNIAIAISGPGASQFLQGPGSAKLKLTNLIAGVLSQGQNQGMASYGMQPGFGGYMNSFGRAGF